MLETRARWWNRFCRLRRRSGLDVVAEGMETRAQLEVLPSLDCERVQGYLYSRPLPVLRAVLRRNKLEPNG